MNLTRFDRFEVDMMFNKLRLILFSVLAIVLATSLAFANSNKSPALLKELKAWQHGLRLIEAELLNDEFIALTAAKTWEQSEGSDSLDRSSIQNMGTVWTKAEITHDNIHIIRSLKMNNDLRTKALKSICGSQIQCVKGEQLREAIVLNKLRIANLYRGQIAKIQAEILGAK
jgi:hypothetical protein